MRSRIAAAWLVALATGAAHGQSMNIDLGSATGGPPADFAAAGEAGTWNTIVPTEGQSIGQPGENWLVGLDGEPTIARVLIPDIDPWATDDGGTTGASETLLDDYLPGPVTLQFRNLLNGTYQVITYAWVPAGPEHQTTVEVDNPLAATTVGGAWPGDATPGITHSIHTVDVIDGNIDIAITGVGGCQGAINGIQLRKLQSLAGDVNGDDVVNVDDLIIVLLSWTDPGHGCDGIEQGGGCDMGDTNGDGTVNIDDLIRVLLDWTG